MFYNVCLFSIFAAAKVVNNRWPDGSSVDAGPWKQLDIWDGANVVVMNAHLDKERTTVSEYAHCETNAAGEGISYSVIIIPLLVKYT